MTHQLWIWLAVAVIYLGFRLLRAATRAKNPAAPHTARMNAAARRILQAQGKPESSSVSAGASQRPGPANAGPGKPARQKYRQPHAVRKPGLPSVARPSAVIRLSTPNTGPAIQRRR